jgi:hypothetical protein
MNWARAGLEKNKVVEPINNISIYPSIIVFEKLKKLRTEKSTYKGRIKLK